MSYEADDIVVLEGLEAVRLRPGMFIGSTGVDGLHHLVWEIVDNSVDEVMNGHAKAISVTLHEDGQTVTVADDGRGIPVGILPKFGKGALEVILTTLHSGGKFNQDNYKTAGGLHGVGSSVVCALSTSLIANIKRDGSRHEQTFSRGVPTSPLKNLGPARGTGTKMTFTPDTTIFKDVKLDASTILERLEIKAFLCAGLKVTFKDEVSGKKVEFCHEGGVSDLLTKVVKESGQEALVEPVASTREGEGLVRADLALTWTENNQEQILTFVNGIPTKEGGTHEQGLKDAVVKAVRGFIDAHDLEPRGIKLTAEDIREGLVGVLSISISEPQFQGQTKDKLNNPEVKSLVESYVRLAVDRQMVEKKSWGTTVVSRAIQAAKARMASRAAMVDVKRKSAVNTRLNLPGKLADCSSSDPSACELFLVEGDSAGGSAKQGRNREYQAILPLRGKVLNTEQATLANVLKNSELADLVKCLGCGMGKDFDISRLRYNRIILLMDADVDGNHIATLLLTFFYRFLQGLITAGHVYVAQPPLYRIESGKDTWWASDDAEKNKILKRLSSRAKPDISRFKGLGEMMPKTLYETTLDPKKRRLLRVTVPPGTEDMTDTVLSDLMGKDASTRYQFIMSRVRDVDSIDV